MLRLLSFDDPRVVGFHIDGHVKKPELARLLGVLKEKLGRHETLRLYIEWEEFEGMSAEAFLKDLGFGLKHWDRFERKAIVTDRRWMHTAARAADRFFPHIEVKAFAEDEEAAARAWISE